jgi:glutathione synthase/RimK-type ligase-like ATP-grasp enzyme
MQHHIRCLIEACKQLQVEFSFLDEEQNLVELLIHQKSFIFQSNRTPFNTEALAGICLDKGHTWQVLHQHIRMPQTLAFMDTHVAPKYRSYLRYHSREAMIEEIEKTLAYPIVVKRNRGALGNNVFLCQNRAEAEAAMERIYNKSLPGYDYIALAQEFISSQQEYRLVCFRGEPVLLYERYAGDRPFKALYWEDSEGRPILVEDQALIQEQMAFLQPMFQRLCPGYVGVDLVRSRSGEWVLLELNSGPRVDHFIEFNGPERIIAMYVRIVQRLLDDAA